MKSYVLSFTISFDPQEKVLRFSFIKINIDEKISAGHTFDTEKTCGDIISSPPIRGIGTTLENTINAVSGIVASLLTAFDHIPDALLFGVETHGQISTLKEKVTFSVTCEGIVPTSSTTTSEIQAFNITSVTLNLGSLTDSDIARFEWINEFITYSEENYKSINDVLSPLTNAITKACTDIMSEMDTLIDLIDRISAHITKVLDEYISLDVLADAMTPLLDGKSKLVELKTTINDSLQPLDPSTLESLTTNFTANSAAKHTIDIYHCFAREAGLLQKAQKTGSADEAFDYMKIPFLAQVKHDGTYNSKESHTFTEKWLPELFTTLFKEVDDHFETTVMPVGERTWFSAHPMPNPAGASSNRGDPKGLFNVPPTQTIPVSNDEPILGVVLDQIEAIQTQITPSILPVNFTEILNGVDDTISDIKTTISSTVGEVGDQINPFLDTAETQIASLIDTVKSYSNSYIVEGPISTTIKAVCYASYLIQDAQKLASLSPDKDDEFLSE
ncbi:hypothetical protein BLNAU_11059 [Blattamonas nauphoetae]|uniref:DNA circulation N-terminal domain-containing protein n=1 Tax=Blattamonas nauphoetae TaxID=2049346 RepID=A0ABQ9XR44_9EUKA|nr:hypothetical protein BLNAU_11059 [Blattamonas nauphoetae]